MLVFPSPTFVAARLIGKRTGLHFFQLGSASPRGPPLRLRAHPSMQGCDRYKYFGSQNQIQNQIRLVLLVLTDSKILYHYGKWQIVYLQTRYRSKLGWFFWFGLIHVRIHRNLAIHPSIGLCRACTLLDQRTKQNGSVTPSFNLRSAVGRRGKGNEGMGSPSPDIRRFR